MRSCGLEDKKRARSHMKEAPKGAAKLRTACEAKFRGDIFGAFTGQYQHFCGLHSELVSPSGRAFAKLVENESP